MVLVCSPSPSRVFSHFAVYSAKVSAWSLALRLAMRSGSHTSASMRRLALVSHAAASSLPSWVQGKVAVCLFGRSGHSEKADTGVR